VRTRHLLAEISPDYDDIAEEMHAKAMRIFHSALILRERSRRTLAFSWYALLVGEGQRRGLL